jgi:protein required for attachment to host cells
MSRHRHLLFVIADGEHVRYARANKNGAFHSEGSLDSAAAHKRSSDLVSDRPGAQVPRSDPQELEKEKFAHLIGERLNAASAAKEFAELVLVAPPHVLNAIRHKLNTTTDAQVIGTLLKDLVKIPDEALNAHLAEWVPPVHRAA